MDFPDHKKQQLNISPMVMILLLGFLIRVVFTVFVAQRFFGRSNIFVDNDTLSWSNCFRNLLETGTYTVNVQNEYGYFVRMPGYSFFLGFFYLLSGKDWTLAYKMAGWTQIFLDVISIFLVYRIGKIIFRKERAALILQLLYACYPFIIVWNPVCYSESVSVLLMLAGFYFFVQPESGKNIFLSGIIWGAGALFRPQLILLTYAAVLMLFWLNRREGQRILRTAGLLSLGFLLVFIAWPVRNYVNHQKLIITQDLRGIPKWKTDVLYFLQYINSVKTEWEPQFSEIINKKEVSWPAASFINPEDSLKLRTAEKLSETCGAGFELWKIKKPGQPSIENGQDCSQQIGELYYELYLSQKKNNAFHYWVVLPLQNLQKAIFKFRLYDAKSAIRAWGSALFLYRMLLIFLGIAGAAWCWRHKIIELRIITLIAVYWLFLYVLLCSGSGPQFRNIEIRYFLHADILLLIPAAFMIDFLFEKIFPRKILPA